MLSFCHMRLANVACRSHAIQRACCHSITSPASVNTVLANHKDYSQERKMSALELQNLKGKGEIRSILILVENPLTYSQERNWL